MPTGEPVYILGLNAYHGDSSACILRDGEVIAASEEERFRRIKHWAGFPSEAIKFCLNEAGIMLQEVDHIAVSRDPKAHLTDKIFTALRHGLNPGNMLNRVKNLGKAGSVEADFMAHFGADKKHIQKKLHQVEHHRSHLASAFYPSPFDEAALLSIDGFGDFTSTMTAVGDASGIKILDSVTYPHSVGLFYTLFTQYLGFPHYGDEYKIMGLAPYGQPVFTDKILGEVIRLEENGRFSLNLEYFNHTRKGVNMTWQNGSPTIGTIFTEKLEALFGPARKKEEPLSDVHRNLATSVQDACEKVIFHILAHLQKTTGKKSICIAGGVAQNSVAMGKVTQHTGFEKVYCPPAGHDAGTAIGAALWVYHQTETSPVRHPQNHAYFGSVFSDDDIAAYLDSRDIKYTRFADADLYDAVTQCLIDGGVAGWFQGRAEFVPRALGNRSIIADPRRDDARDLLNRKIKRRESFRPFAPSILFDQVPNFFEQTDDVPFMEKVFLIRPEKRSLIPAVTHVDGTGRLQTVRPEANARYYALIKNFYDKTGIPILLNTSFNENEPIVNAPAEALDCFLRTEMDMLILGNVVVRR
ncbi:MAG: carbamoyltransferase [Mucilaginibacter polytrichastri]|nr:carbamoyltransferase [Mucilaginibacter polytrichastri]